MTFEPQKYNDMRYFLTDPVEVVHRCVSKRDIEVMGIVCSWLAFGNRLQIHKKCSFAYDLMGQKPYAYVMSETWRQYKDSPENFYRMLFYRDFHDLMLSLYNIYNEYPTLEDAVLSSQPPVETRHASSPSDTRCCTDAVLSSQPPVETRPASSPNDPSVSLIASLLKLFHCAGIPKDTTSACKRIVMFLRWMVRRDGKVDFGIWQRIDPKLLLIPLDVHVLNITRELGLITRKQADMKAALELASHCRALYPDDPAIMDFALFTLDYENAHTPQ